jgi:oxalate decarboxylase/phosphoglucose isomerase-like protein (cupin superfamily)
MNGNGTVTVSAQGMDPETADIAAGDAIPIQLNDVHSVENTSGEPLEFMIVGVSRDNNRRVDVVHGEDLPRRRN